MRIGIDARPLATDQLTGIGTYLNNILKVFTEKYPENEYFLYSNQQINNLNPKLHLRVFKCPRKISPFVFGMFVKRKIVEDGIDVFWGPRHFLPPRVDGIKYVLTVHDVAVFVNRSWFHWKNVISEYLFTKRSIKRADEILVVSESTKKDLIYKFHVDDKRIHQIYLGVEIYEQEHANSSSAKYLLYLGTIEPRKNIDNIVRAFEIVSNEYPDISLKIAGGLGWKYESTLKVIDDYCGPSAIEMLGYVDSNEKSCLYANALAFLFPSHYEGFGLPIVEAMKSGTIVVTASNSSLLEVGGDAAFYVKDENDVNEIVARITEIINLSDDARALRVAQGKAWASKFSWEKCANDTISIIQSTIH